MLTKPLQKQFYRKYRTQLIFLIDLVITAFSYFMSFLIVSLNFRFDHLHILPIWVIMDGLFVSLGAYLISFQLFGVPKSIWKYTGPSEVIRIVGAVTTAVLLSLSIRPLYVHYGLEARMIVVNGVFVILFMCDVRLFYRLMRRREQISNKKVPALIIGAGDAGYMLAREIYQNHRFDADIVGFIDDAKAGKIVYGKRVLADTANMAAIVERYGIQLAFIAMPSAAKKDIRRIYEQCRQLRLTTKIMKESNQILENPDQRPSYPVEDISIEDLLGRGEISLEQEELRSYLAHRVIAVTGAGGSIGSELCRQILKFEPKELLMIDINENALYMLEQEFEQDKRQGSVKQDIRIVSIITSIREYASLDTLFRQKRPDVVYHAAAHKHVPLMETWPAEAVKNNIFGTDNVIRCCIANKVSQMIMISSDEAVNPINVMGASKRMTEMILQANGDNGITKMAAVRFGNVLGSNGSVIPIFRNQIKEGGPLTITDKEIIRYFMTIPEAAQLVLQAGFYADKGDIFVLDMGEPVKILDLAEKMIRLAGYEPYKDIDIVEIGLRPGEKMFEELRLDGETTERTKNNLIFVHPVMKITKAEMDEKLQHLNEVMKDHVSGPLLKNMLLEMIQQNKTDT